MAIYEMPDGNKYEINDPTEVESLYASLSKQAKQDRKSTRLNSSH